MTMRRSLFEATKRLQNNAPVYVLFNPDFRFIRLCDSASLVYVVGDAAG
jgi:hypothetical protein